MESIGYRSLKVKSLEELAKIDKPEYSIEVLCGGIASGKTYSMDKYYEENDNIIYVKFGSKSDKFYNQELEEHLILNEINKDELLEKLKGINKNKILIYDNCSDIRVKKVIDTIIKFAQEKKYTLLLDQSSIDISSLKDAENVNIVCSQIKKPKIPTDIFKMPVAFTFMDYKIKDKLLNEVFSGNISLRLPKSLHKQLSSEAYEEGISLNQYLLYILSSR